MKRQKNSTEDTLGDVKARGEWLMASGRWSRARSNQTAVKSAARWREKAKKRENEMRGRGQKRAIEGGRESGSAKVNRPRGDI